MTIEYKTIWSTRTKKLIDVAIFDTTTFYYHKTKKYWYNGYRGYLHRYVYTHFMGTIPDDHDIHHLDGDKDNNDISNLRCISHVDHQRLTHLGTKRTLETREKMSRLKKIFWQNKKNGKSLKKNK